MSEQGTEQVIDIGSSCVFTERDDGSVHISFPDFDLEAAGADRDDAFKNLIDALGIATQDEAVAQRFNEWAQDHIVERPMNEEDARDERMIQQAAEEAGHEFRQLDTVTFDEAIATEHPLLVDFWAPWCRPCLMLAPVLVEIHGDLRGRFEIAKVNVDENPELSDRFGIQGIPCMIMFKRTEEVGRIVGMGPKYAIHDQIVSLLEKA